MQTPDMLDDQAAVTSYVKLALAIERYYGEMTDGDREVLKDTVMAEIAQFVAN